MGQPRPYIRELFHDGVVRSPRLVDYPYGLIFSRGLVRVMISPGLSADQRVAIARLLEKEADLLREEARRVSPWLVVGNGAQSQPVKTPGDAGTTIGG